MNYSIEEKVPRIWFADLKVDGEKEYTGAYIVASGDEFAMVDVGPASTAEKMLSALREIGVSGDQVKYILLTHIHLDHGGAAGELMQHLPIAKVVAHKVGIPHMIDPEKTLLKSAREVLRHVAEIYGKPEPVSKERTISVKERMNIDLGERTFQAVVTPGHASHHVCFFLRPERVIFTGDAAGVYVPSLDVILPATPPPFKLKPALKSIEALISLKPRISAYTHFGISYDATRNLRKHQSQLINWYESIGEFIDRGVRDEEEIMGLLSKRDSNLAKFLANSEDLGGLRRGVRTSVRGFINLSLKK